MSNKRKTVTANTASPNRNPGKQGVRLIPSRIWWKGARALWSGLSLRERAMILLGVFLPVLDQVARLGSLGVTMKAVGRAVRQPLDLEARLWLSLLIFCAFCVATLIQMFSGRAKRDLKLQLTELVRKVHGRMMANAAELPREERAVEVKTLLKEEKDFVSSATSGLSALIEFLSSVQLVTFLLVVLIWFNPIVGAILFVCGLSALLILRFRIRKPATMEGDKIGDAREEMLADLEAIATNRSDRSELIEKYGNNQFDKLVSEEAKLKSKTQSKISSTMNFTAAILMALVFYLISAEGAFDEEKVVWIVIFVFGLRMVVSQGRTAMVKWGGVLGEKNALMLLAKGALAARTRDDEGEHEDHGDTEADEEETAPAYGSLARIVDYSFSGLNGPEIVSREPLVLEITVEADVGIEGFNWSFNILPPNPSTYIISKTSQDYGISWTLPAGRTRLRVVSGPVWLPPAIYSGRLGIAKGNRTLDLVGSTDFPVTLCVLPDEVSKRSVQTRVAHDVVIMDVEWELEFRWEHSQFGETQTGSPLLF